MLDQAAIQNIYYIFLGLAVLVLIIGGMQIPIEAKDDPPLMARKLAFLIMVMLAAATFRPVTNFINRMALEQRDIARSEILRDNYDILSKETNVEKEATKGKSWFSSPVAFIKDTIKFMLMTLVRWIARLFLFVPNLIRSLACATIAMILTASFLVSPLMVAMLTVRQTEGTGWRFVLATIALAVSPIIFPVVDYIFVNFFGTIITVCIGALLPSAVTAGLGLTEMVLAIVGTASLSWGAAIALTIIMILLLVFVVMFLIFGYFVAPFAFVKFLASGEMASTMSGAFSSMTGYAQKTASMGIEGAEAGARTAKKSSDLKGATAKQAQAVGDVMEHGGASRAGAMEALRMAGGNTLSAITWAKQEGGKQPNPPPPPSPVDVPAGMKRPV